MSRFTTRNSWCPLVAATTLVAGCGQSNSRGAGDWVTTGDRTPQGDQSATLMLDARPAALVSGDPISWMELRPLMAEAAGGQAIEEVILDRQIDFALAERGIVVTPEDAARERTLLLESLSDEPSTAVRLLDELKKRQGLGPVRFNALLMRNASLRALVRDDVQVDDNDAAMMFDIRHGEKRQGRVIILPNLTDATNAMHRIRDGEAFADVAADVSIDSSAPRGGLLEPISRLDPSYPQTLRNVLYKAAEGEVSAPILMENQYAIVQLVRILLPEDVPFDEVRDDMRRLARLRAERVRMDQLARAMMRDVRVTIFDESLQDSWTRQRGR